MIAMKKPIAGSVTVQLDGTAIEVPERVRQSLAAFRVWAGDNDLPEKTRVDFYRGKVWVDMGREQVFTHGLLKTEIVTALGSFIEREDRGFICSSGVLVTNEGADLSGNPDGTFVSFDSIKSERMMLGETVDELVGTPDMVLEVVSPSSVTKDKVSLREAYFEAGILEYWLVDARGDRLEFQILKRGDREYTDTRKVGGWLKSAVFGKSFKLSRDVDRSGNPSFKLGVK